MTDKDRADKVRESLEMAESLLSEMDQDADFLVSHVNSVVEEALAELTHISFDDEGHIIPVDDDDIDDDLEDDEDEDEDDDEEDREFDDDEEDDYD